MSVKIKICGITNAGDALAAVEAGADALGFVFYEASPRYLQWPAAANIIRQLPPFVAKVGVFVNAMESFIKQTIEECRLDTLQFHGEEPPEFCHKFSVPVIKAFRVQNAESLRSLPRYDLAAWLLDSYQPAQAGGTGARFDWPLAVEASKLGRPIILAGGLTPENVAEAVRQVRPFAVDVSSGVEAAPGKKDPAKLRAFTRAARSAWYEL
jgi:phosphoribosylanthranilate isomerase